MYKVALDEDWSFLLGKQLEQVCIGSYNVQLHFNHHAAISIQGDDSAGKYFFHKTAARSSPTVGKIAEIAVSLISLLGASVLKVTAENSTTLALYFSNLEELRIYDTSDSFESFTVDGGPNGLIVV
jgi:hypothetical protein